MTSSQKAALCLAWCLGILAGFCFQGCERVLVFSPDRPAMALQVQTEEPPLAMGDPDRILLNRLMPHIEQRVAKRIEEELAKVTADLEATEPKLGAPVGGFATTLAAAIVWVVKRIVLAIIATILMALLFGLAVKYWPLVLGVVLAFFVTAGLAGRAAARREIDRRVFTRNH